MFTLVNGLSAKRSLLGIELLHLGLQGSAEGGPHIARFVARFKPYKCGLLAHFVRGTQLTLRPSHRR